MKIRIAMARAAKAPFVFEDADLEAPRDDEVLVRIVASCICHTDVAVLNQDINLPFPIVLGHEGAGVVEAVGKAVTHLRAGDHVAMSGDSCGVCTKCQRAQPFYCDDFVTRNLTGFRVDGSSPISQHGRPIRGRFVGQSSFATHTVARARSLSRVPSDLPLELMGPLGCGLTTGFGTVVNALRPPAGSSVAVFGVGTVGLAAVMGARHSGCARIVAVDVRRSRLDMALELGATHVIDASKEPVVAAIAKLVPGGVDFSVECSGVPAVVRQAVDCLARPGWCAQVGATPGGAQIAFDMDGIGMGRGIRGVVMGDAVPANFVPFLAELFRDGRLPFDRFVKFYDFADIDRAVHDSAVTGEVIKPVLRMG